MRKSYTKPEIYFESFSLSTNIANECDHPFTLAAKYVCGIPDENGLGMYIFTPGPSSNCVISGGEANDEYDGFCYHISAGNGMLFSS